MSLGPVTEITPDAADNPMMEFREGIEMLKNEYPEKALPRLKRAFESDNRNAYYMSFLGLAIARAQRKWDKAAELCEMAIHLNPKEIQFRLNLGEVFALAGRREQAVYTLDHASKLFGDDTRLKQALSKVENRRAPVLPLFGRGHFLNRELGRLRHRVLKSLDK
jgi:Flp pilus assembly protein TadD